MEIKILRESGILKISLVGELDHHSAKSVVSALDFEREALPANFVLDMAGVSFMDSSGIAVVLGLSRKMSDIGGALTVKNTPPHAMRVFNAANLQKFVSFE